MRNILAFLSQAEEKSVLQSDCLAFGAYAVGVDRTVGSTTPELLGQPLESSSAGASKIVEGSGISEGSGSVSSEDPFADGGVLPWTYI